MKVKIIDESQLTRPYISKKAMLKVVSIKDNQLKARDYRIKVITHDAEQWLHLAEEEKLMLIALEKKLERQIKLTYILGVTASLIGGFVGYICG
jgi:predicted membrane-bound spermidine synthase